MNMKRKPLVSVIMPSYNAQDYISEAIKSILAQTYEKFELIIINDASTDRTLQIIKRFKDRRIKVITLTKNLNGGGDSCANIGIEKARGKYIARMDADDIALPTRLERQVEFLEENKSVFLVGSQAQVIDKNGNYIGEKEEPKTVTDIYNAYFTFHPLIHPTCMFRRKIGKKTFSYKIRYSANNDYYTFFSLICKGFIFANLDETLLKLRVHGKNDTFVNIKEKFLNTLKIRLKMVMFHGYRPSPKSVIINFVQAATILLLPESILIPLYFKMKGISNALPTTIPSININRLIK